MFEFMAYRESWRSKISYPRVSPNFQAFSFIPHLLREVFPFVFYHPFKPVYPCFKDSDVAFLSLFGFWHTGIARSPAPWTGILASRDDASEKPTRLSIGLQDIKIQVD
jgi:hypothetical protein